MAMRVRIFLVEERLGDLDEVEQLLRTQAGIEIVGRTLSGAKIVAKVNDSNADLVLMDWQDGQSGVEALGALKTLANTPAVIVLAGHDHPHFHAAVKALGAQASLHRKKYRTELLPLIDVERNSFRSEKQRTE